MNQSCGDISLLLKSIEKEIKGFLDVYVYVQLEAETSQFERCPKMTERHFELNPRKYDEIHVDGVQMKSNGEGYYLLHQRLKILLDTFSFEHYFSHCHELVRLGYNRLDVAVVTNIDS